MFTTISVEKILFSLIGISLVLCLFSTIGCSGGGIGSVQMQDLRQRVKIVESERDEALRRAETVEAAKAKAESERNRALRRAETAETAKVRVESERNRALRRAETAETAKVRVESERDKALQRSKIPETAKVRVESERDKALRRAKTAEAAKVRVESERDKALRRAETAEAAKVRVESERDKALRRAETAETAKVRVESERDKALRRAETAETTKVRVESERDEALRRAKALQEQKKNLEKRVNLVPEAIIKNVRLDRKKKSMDILATFSINNRKDIKGSVDVFFYFQDGRPLRDKRGSISISQEFTPKRVKDEQTVKVPVSYSKLHVTQPADLKFTVRIHDKPTDRFLEKESHSKSFSYDPFKD